MVGHFKAHTNKGLEEKQRNAENRSQRRRAVYIRKDYPET